jgi:hypothetical protein
MTINTLNIKAQRTTISEYEPSISANVAPILKKRRSYPLRDMIAKSLEDANLFYIASYSAPTDLTKIWEDLNGTNQGESTNVAGEYKVYKAGAWVAMTQADLPRVIAANTLIDNVTITRNANGELVAGDTNTNTNPLPDGVTIVDGIIHGLKNGIAYNIKGRAYPLGQPTKTLGVQKGNGSYAPFAAIADVTKGMFLNNLFEIMIKGSDNTTPPSGTTYNYVELSGYGVTALGESTSASTDSQGNPVAGTSTSHSGFLSGLLIGTPIVYSLGLAINFNTLSGFNEIYSITELTPL